MMAHPGGPSVLAARVGFAIMFAACLLTIWTVCHIIHALPGLGPKRRRNGFSIIVSQMCFRYIMLAPCRWINLKGVQEVDEAWHKASQAGTPFVLANHNSMLDSLLVTALIPRKVSFNLRSLIKLGLFKIPVFGYICKAVGHFPVFFKGTADGDFSVDKEAQAKVAEEMDSFLADNGGLVIFPEGQLNSNPRQLQSFRRGAFTLPRKHRKPIWAFINVGCEKSWPKGAPIGGWPTDIEVKLWKVCDDAGEFEDNAALAEFVQQQMQREVDLAYERFDASAQDKKTA